MSIDGFGSEMRLPGAKLVELHEHQIPDLDEAVAVFVGRAGGPPGILSPWSKKISEHGPQGRYRPSARNCPRSGCG